MPLDGLRQGDRRRDGSRGLRRRAGEAFCDRVEHELMYGSWVTEADFDLGRMDIHVHSERIDLEEQHVGGMTLTVKDIAVRVAQRMRDQLVPNGPAVYVDELGVARGPGEGRRTCKAVEPYGAAVRFYRTHRPGELRTELPPDPVVRTGRRSEEHTSELQSRGHLVCRLLLE